MLPLSVSKEANAKKTERQVAGGLENIHGSLKVRTLLAGPVLGKILKWIKSMGRGFLCLPCLCNILSEVIILRNDTV